MRFCIVQKIGDGFLILFIQNLAVVGITDNTKRQTEYKRKDDTPDNKTAFNGSFDCAIHSSSLSFLQTIKRLTAAKADAGAIYEKSIKYYLIIL